MKSELNIPWERYGLIAELTDRLKELSPQFGKTILQKMVYLLQEAYGVDCGYSFNLYTYGPFTSQIMQDLDMVESLRGVKINSVDFPSNGYTITPGERNIDVREQVAEFLKRNNVSNSLSKLIKVFGKLNATQLSLLSTILYVVRDMEKERQSLSREKLINMVKEIKPNFSEQDIYDNVTMLESEDIISLN
jgi:uncharacterized protein YwgA